jgi:hypothetical protein
VLADLGVAEHHVADDLVVVGDEAEVREVIIGARV